MAVCINKNLSEYQALKEMSGIPEIVLDFYCSNFLDKYDRLPELDELPQVNSENYLRNAIKVTQIGDIDFADNAAIENTIGVLGEEASIKINNIYKDLEVSVIQTSQEKSMIEIRHRPSEFTVGNEEITGNFEVNPETQRIVLRQMLDRMRNLYGINLIEMSTDELRESGIFQQIPDANTARAFVFNGNIYINSDLAGLDAPVHEMLHIFLGGMRFTNPNTYINLIKKVSEFKSAKRLAEFYPNRTQNDLLEEVFVTEMANLLTGKPTELNSLSKKEISTIMYEIRRNLDTMLMGNRSVKNLNIKELTESTILELAGKVQSTEFNTTELNIMDLADMHRRTANVKSSLMQSGELEEICK